MKSWFLGLRPTVRDLLVLIALGAALWLTSSGMWDLRGPDEGRYVQIAKELLGRDNWLYLTVHGVPYDQKPPLAFWLFALMLKINGGDVSSWATRLPSVLAAIGTVVITYFLGCHSFGRRTGLFAALMLMTAPAFFDNAPTAELNMLYTAAISASLYAWITRPTGTRSIGSARLITFWGSLAAAFFIKGPLSFIIVISVVVLDAWHIRSWSVVRQLRPLAGTLVIGGLIGVWLYLQRVIYGAEFVKEQVTGETLKRVLSGDHGQPFWYYLPRLFTSVLFPWAMLGILPVVTYIKSGGAEKVAPSVKPYLAWIGFPFLLLCVANGKRQAYLLPLLPAAAVLLGAGFNQGLADKVVRRWIFGSAIAFFAALGVLISAIGITAVLSPELAQTDIMWISPFGMALLLLCGIALMLIAARLLFGPRHATRLFYATVGVILVLAWGNFMIIRPAFDPSKSTRFLADTLDMELKNRNGGQIPEHVVIGAIGKASEPEYHVYGHYEVEPMRSADARQISSLSTLGPNLLLIEKNSKQYMQTSKSLLDAGYLYRRSLLASKESLELYKKPDNPNTPESSDTKSFFFVGDTGTGNRQIYNVVREMANRNSVNPVQAVFLLGDNLYHGEVPSRSLHSLFAEPFAPLISRLIPIYAALGNHDYNNRRLRAEVEFPLFNMAGSRYYSLDYGVGPISTSIFVADSEALHNGDPDQLAWLDAALNSSTAKWKILVMHRPIEASQINHGASKKLRRLLQPMLKEVDVVFLGHNHIYERRNVVDGVLHITTGSGGQLTTETLPADRDRAIGYNQFGSFVEMKVDDGSIAITAWNENGEKIDDVTLRKSTSGLSLENDGINETGLRVSPSLVAAQ